MFFWMMQAINIFNTSVVVLKWVYKKVTVSVLNGKFKSFF